MRPGLCNGAVSVRPSVRPSICPIYRPALSALRRVCCCGPGGHEISIDSGGRRTPSSTAPSSKCELAVSRCQLTYRKLVFFPCFSLVPCRRLSWHPSTSERTLTHYRANPKSNPETNPPPLKLIPDDGVKMCILLSLLIFLNRVFQIF